MYIKVTPNVAKTLLKEKLTGGQRRELKEFIEFDEERKGRRTKAKIAKRRKKVQELLQAVDYNETYSHLRDDLIKKATSQEKRLKAYLQLFKVKYEFQKIIPRSNGSIYIVDFYIPEKNIIIEVDGGYHYDGKQIKKDNVQ